MESDKPYQINLLPDVGEVVFNCSKNGLELLRSFKQSSQNLGTKLTNLGLIIKFWCLVIKSSMSL